MSDVNALMDKLKSTVAYKQFDSPRAVDQAWPVLEKMALAQSSLSQPVRQSQPVHQVMASAPRMEAAAPAYAPAPAAAIRAPDILVTEAPAEGSLFQRLHADAAPSKSGAFSRYGAANVAEDAPQALSDIFERIGRKAS